MLGTRTLALILLLGTLPGLPGCIQGFEPFAATPETRPVIYPRPLKFPPENPVRVKGPALSRSAAAQTSLATALRKVFRKLNFQRFEGQRIYLPHWTADQSWKRYPGPIPAYGRYLTNLLVEGVIFAGGRIVHSPREADIALLVLPEVLGAQTTHREYRPHGYPVYLHDETYQAVRVGILGYNFRSETFYDIQTGTAFGTHVEPYILDMFGFEVQW